MKHLAPDKRVSYDSLVDLLQHRAKTTSDKIVYEFLSSHESNESQILTYRQLAERAIAIALMLQELGLKPGDRAMLVFAPGLELIVACFGCLYARVIAVPVNPPSGKKQLLDKLIHIYADSDPKIILTQDDLAEKLKSIDMLSDNKRFFLNSERVFTLPDSIVSTHHFDNWVKEEIRPEDLAFIQYTSGSTSIPKGVMLSHRNLLSNLNLIRMAFSLDSTSHGVFWLPPYHDMGLIGGILGTLQGGCSSTLMSPLRFIRNPLNWLQTISDRRASISGGPNFAYEYCTNKITDEQMRGLDLSTWEIAFNGAEPVNPETFERFYNKFSKVGFRKEAFYPCYGLAEATLLVSAVEKLNGYQSIVVDRNALHAKNVEIVSSRQEGKVLSSSGSSFQDIKIINPETNIECNTNEVGEIWVYGPCVAEGYWNNPSASSQIFRAKRQDLTKDARYYLRTGDMGFIHDRHLYVTGRIKELIIIHGKNYYPDDLESIASRSHPQLRPEETIAFSIEGDGEEKLALVCECEVRAKFGECNYLEVIEAIRKSISKGFEINVSKIALVKPNSLPKTSSGKKRRLHVKELWEKNELNALYVSDLSIEKKDRGNERAKNQLELALCSLCEACFNTTVHLADTFLDLGGDSLIAAQLASRIEMEFGLKFEAAFFFNDPSIEVLAKHISHHLTKESKRDKALYSSKKRPGSIPLSYYQEGLWFLDKLTPDIPLNNLNLVLSFSGQLNIALLESSLNAIMKRHEVLGARIKEKQGMPFLVLNTFMPIRLHLEDLSSHTSNQDEVFEVLVRDCFNYCFDLSSESLLKFCLVKRSACKHSLIVTIHHSICDGGSVNIFINELTEYYNVLLREGEPLLPQLLIQYPDYCVLQHHQQNLSDVLEKQKAYWLNELDGVPEVIALPLDKLRPDIPTFNVERVCVLVPDTITFRLKEMGRVYKTSLFTVLLSCFSILLARYSSQYDFAVATPVSQRTDSQLEKIIGYFVNVLPLNCSIPLDLTFSEYLLRMREKVLYSLSNREYPFDYLLRAMNIKRHSNILPLCQVMFSLQIAQKKVQMDGLDVSLRLDHSLSRFDLTLICEESEGGLNCIFEYSSELFYRDSMVSMSQNWLTLLASILDNPDGLPAKFPLLSKHDYHLVTNTWNQTSIDYGCNNSITALFEAQVMQHPDAVALKQNDQELSYHELNVRANQLAHYLRNSEVRHGDLVAVCLERSFDLIVALLAVLKLGGAYIPLDPEYPQERLKYMLKASKAKFLITQSQFEQKSFLHTSTVFCIDSLHPICSMQSSLNPQVQTASEDLAYVIYTSGSSGKPKGVMNTNKSVLNQLLWIKNQYGFDKNDTLLQRTSYSFDASVWEIFLPLIAGAKLILISSQKVSDIDHWIHLIRTEKIRVVQFVPILLESFLERIPSEMEHHLRLIACGGGALSAALAKRCCQAFPKTRLLNFYGPTETAIQVSVREYNTEDVPDYVSIGKPVANTQLYILDKFLNPLPPQVPGELYIGGTQVGLGYLHQEELTAEKFISDPFGSNRDRLYKTGDLCCRKSDGDIEFLGRIDTQIKLRGFRIEPGEIEEVLRHHELIKDALVFMKEDPSEKNEVKLVSYCILKNNTDLPDASLLRIYLRQYLPEYMIPAYFIFLDTFPLLPNGKLDYNSLPIPEKKLLHPYRAARDSVECTLVEIWEKNLKHHPIGIDDNFFDLGGYSLLAVQLINQMNQEFHVDLSISDLFHYNNIESLSALIKNSRLLKSKSTVTPMQIKGRGTPFFAIHPAGGQVFCYLDLAHCLGKNQPFYGIQQYVSGGKNKSIESMAAFYIQEMKKIQPQGPYQLLGWSFGGVIAHEMCSQLEDSGETVIFLGLIDTFIIEDTFDKHKYDELSLLLYFFRELSLKGQKDFHFAPEEFMNKNEKDLWHVFLKKALQSGMLHSETELQGLQKQYAIYKENILALIHHKPKFTKAFTVLFRAKMPNEYLNEGIIRKNTEYWRAYTSDQLQVYDIEGTHDTIMQKPFCDELASKINQLLRFRM